MKRNGQGSQKTKTSSRSEKKKGPPKKNSVYRIPTEITGILLAGLWLIIIFSLHTGRGGFLGNGLRTLLFGLFGVMAYLYAYAAMMISVFVIFRLHQKPVIKNKMSSLLILITVLMLLIGIFDSELIELIREESYLRTLQLSMMEGLNRTGSGLVSAALLYWMVYIIGRMGSMIFLVTIAIAAIWFSSPQLVIDTLKHVRSYGTKISQKYGSFRKIRKESKEVDSNHTTELPVVEPGDESEGYPDFRSPQLLEYNPVRQSNKDKTQKAPLTNEKFKGEQLFMNTPVDSSEEDESVENALKNEVGKSDGKVIHPYRIPPLYLLQQKQVGSVKTDRRKMLSKAKLLEETLASFGVEAKVIKVTQGPTITRYELQPSKGVKVSKVVNLNDDIALNLAASSIRIEAPIPGKAAIGIEIPNEEVAMVPLKELLESEPYKQFSNPLPFVLGKNVAGDAVVFDINKMPHLLVAGATGSGKSVCINALILSLLFKSRPDEVKLLMIDPKVVELNQYNGIPHLMIPVVTDPKKATGALRWAVTEMEERYHKFAENGVRDIAGFNEKMKADKLPYVVVIIDELADLMLVAAKEVEDYICRLAQMARASGIHLIIATQRPSVDVITGIIKANIPSRVAFSVASQVDSRTILDMGGAEKLLGKGDMLFHPIGISKPVRIQGAFVSEEEVKRVVDFLKAQSGEPEYEEEIMEKLDALPAEAEEHESDDVFQEALRIAYDHQQISISMLQRRLKMGYNRAARLIDEMEARGYVGPNEGTKPRKVINRTQAEIESGEKNTTQS